MNRIKILLTAVGVLTVVGSALAYSGTFGQKVCYINKPATGGCTTSLDCTTFGGAHEVDEQGFGHCYKVVSNSATNCSGVKCEADEGEVSTN